MNFRQLALLALCAAHFVAPTAALAASKAKGKRFELEMVFVVAKELMGSDGGVGSGVKKWLSASVTRAEEIYSEEPSLSVRWTIQPAQAPSLADWCNGRESPDWCHSDAAYKAYMDKYFDNMAENKTTGRVVVVVVPFQFQVGEASLLGAGFYPAHMRPFKRRTGLTIAFKYDVENKSPKVAPPTALAHELGHVFGLRHAWVKYPSGGKKEECSRDFGGRSTCSGDVNVMDYCTGETSSVSITNCQAERAAKQRVRLMTADGLTNYRALKGLFGHSQALKDNAGFSAEDTVADTRRDADGGNRLFFRKGGKEGSVRGYLPGHTKKNTVHYTDHNGVAVFEGDIVLGDTKGLADRLKAPVVPKRVSKARGRADADKLLVRGALWGTYLWPQGEIPYVISAGMAANPKQTELIRSTMATLALRTNLRFAPRVDEPNYIEFVVGEACASRVGMQGGRQTVELLPQDHPREGGGYCDGLTIAHELLHAAGFWHEQSRNDRDDHIKIQMKNVESGQRFNFGVHGDWWHESGVKVGDYDVSSIMHYDSCAFSRFGPNCSPSTATMLKRDGTMIANPTDLSPGDVAGINAVYPRQ